MKEKKNEIDKLRVEEEQAGVERDYERAAQKKAERLRLEQDFTAKRDKWESEHHLDEVVDVNDIAEVVHQWTGIPLSQMMESESDKLLHMEERLHERIIGQDEAIHAISDAIRRARSGLKDPSRPIGSFIFIGPSGVGKTELAKALAWFMFGDEEALVRLDMSEYREQHTASRLFGAPPGYVGYEEGGQLTEAVRRRPYRVVLFDEIEKAHPEVWNALLQILDDGRLTDGQGRIVDFRNTVLIMTSNLAADYIQQESAKINDRNRAEIYEEMKGAVLETLRESLRPEFLNRIDEMIVFAALTKEEVRRIVRVQLHRLQALLTEREIVMDVSDAAVAQIAEISYDPSFGARPIKRYINKELAQEIAKMLLAGKLKPGETLQVDVRNGELTMKGTPEKVGVSS